MKLIASVLLITAVVAIAARHASAQESGWTVTSFGVRMGVARDSSVTVIEDISVDFGTLERHGIIRDIPDEYTYDKDKNRMITIDDVSVDDGTSPVPFQRQRSGHNVRLKIGDPDFLVTGPQRYRITYTVHGALNPFADHDELYWNVTGNAWTVAIERATAGVDLPGGPVAVDCFQGPAGSTDRCRITGADTHVNFAATAPLDPGSGLTLVVSLPKGLVQVPPLVLVDAHADPLQRARDFFGLSLVTWSITLALMAMVVAGILRLWWLIGRDRWYGDNYYLTQDHPMSQARPLFAHQTIVVEYQPPEVSGDGRRLRPAEIGLLLDERADTLDVSATIVDLAVRKYLLIKELPTGGVFGLFKSQDYELERLDKPNGDLLPYESKLLAALFESGQTVQLSDLKNKFHDDLTDVKDELYEESVSRNKFFPFNPDTTRQVSRIAGVAIAVVGGVATWLLGAYAGAGLVPIPVIIGGLALFFLAPLMPRRTASGWEMYRRCLGFRLYMVTAETDRQKFAEQANIFHEYLPFAIVYGCVDKWAKAFEGLADQPQPYYYAGTGPFIALAFANNVNSFSTSISGVMAATPGGGGGFGGGGSGFGGGGFSGGGGGGGGGSSW